MITLALLELAHTLPKKANLRLSIHTKTFPEDSKEATAPIRSHLKGNCILSLSSYFKTFILKLSIWELQIFLPEYASF